MSDSGMLTVKNLYSGYGVIKVLKDVSLEIARGEIVTVIGANGAGKSTLLMTICGDVRTDSGTVLLKNRDITNKPTYEIMRDGVAISPEGRRIFPKLTVEENLLLGAYHIESSVAYEELQGIYQMFPRLDERKGQLGGTLSGGEQQMLAIGRALMSKPELLLLDEPSLGLAPIIIQQIFATLEKIRDAGTTIFLVEQNANKALAIADRGYVLEGGEIVLSGTGEELSKSPEVKKAYLGG
mgnify:FL=1